MGFQTRIDYQFWIILVVTILHVRCESGVREKRGAAYAGAHPGGGSGGYGTGGVGIPGINNALQYWAYSTLLNQGNHGGGGSSHGRKLTVDQAIGMFGHHTLNRPYPYTGGHDSNSQGSRPWTGSSGGYSGSGGSSHGGGSRGGSSYGR